MGNIHREREVVDALRRLHSMVKAECPSLLNEDSGGDAELSIEIEEMINPDRDHLMRRERFIHDIIEVCRHHRVMLNDDPPEALDDWVFEEHPEGGSAWILNLCDLEHCIRMALFDEIKL